jgi:alpha-glucosidase (family GH31 glycosyl hydrolase)
MKEFHWCNFEWDARVFPDPEGMLRRSKEKRLRICVWINPYIENRDGLVKETGVIAALVIWHMRANAILQVWSHAVRLLVKLLRCTSELA